MDVTEFFKRVAELKLESQYLKLKLGRSKGPGFSCLLIEDIGYEVLTFEQANNELNSWHEDLEHADIEKPKLPHIEGEFVRCYIPNGPPCFFCVDTVLSVEPVKV